MNYEAATIAEGATHSCSPFDIATIPFLGFGLWRLSRQKFLGYMISLYHSCELKLD